MATNNMSTEVSNGSLASKSPAVITDVTASSRPDSLHSESSFHSTSAEISHQDTPASSTDASKVSSANAKQPREDFRLPTSGPLKTPIPYPLPESKIPTQKPLTSEQQSKYATVLSEVSKWTTLPTSTAKKAPLEPFNDTERMWLTQECLLRYLRATKWNVPSALTRLQSTLVWRREYGADTFTFEYISPENETGKQCILGYDNDARPCLYLSPGKQNTEMSDRQIHHLCFMLDRTIDMLPPGQENACLIINFTSTGGGKIPTVGQARAVLNILQNHNPERLGRALISETPWYVNTFFKLISPFIDPVTREKMKFNEDLKLWVPKGNLWKHAKGGELNFEYEHPVYWAALEKQVKEKREAFRQRWVEGGSRIGEYEEYLRGGNKLSLGQEAAQTGAGAEQDLATGVNGLKVEA